MVTLNALKECHKFDEMLKSICGDLFGAYICPGKINFFNKGCIYPNVRYISTHEAKDKGCSFKLWTLRKHRCDLYTAYVKYYTHGGYTIVFPEGMFDTATADWLFSSSFHMACEDLKKDNRQTALDILEKTGVLVSTSFIQIQKDLIDPNTLRFCYLQGKHMVFE
jgi:hypothetical protein